MMEKVDLSRSKMKRAFAHVTKTKDRYLKNINCTDLLLSLTEG